MHDDEGIRGRLVRAGAELVAEEGSAAVSLREIARRAGVSHGAPRRYFPTHVELLSAIAREGFADLTACLRAVPAGASPRARLGGLAQAYVAFAQEHRGMYELMFRHDLLRSDRLGLRETSLPLFEMLAALLEATGAGAGDRLTATGADAGDRLTAAGAGAGDRLAVAGAGAGDRLAVAGAGAGDRLAVAGAGGRLAVAGAGAGDRLVAAGAGAGDRLAAAGALWANLHGIVQLWLWGSLPLATGQADITVLVDVAVEAHAGRGAL